MEYQMKHTPKYLAAEVPEASPELQERIKSLFPEGVDRIYLRPQMEQVFRNMITSGTALYWKVPEQATAAGISDLDWACFAWYIWNYGWDESGSLEPSKVKVSSGRA